MSGGTITGNTTNYNYGGGGVFVSYGTFTMSGGTISGNTAAAYDSDGGGGVFVSYGTFTMSGGTISGNTARYYGGGVYVYGGAFTKQSGGIIYGSDANAALKNTASVGDSGGHAVYVNSSPAKMRNITAGEGVALDNTVSGTAGGWE
jgi:hypothetical protein